jgi:hypothetical protein
MRDERKRGAAVERHLPRIARAEDRKSEAVFRGPCAQKIFQVGERRRLRERLAVRVDGGKRDQRGRERCGFGAPAVREMRAITGDAARVRRAIERGDEEQRAQGKLGASSYEVGVLR